MPRLVGKFSNLVLLLGIVAAVSLWAAKQTSAADLRALSKLLEPLYKAMFISVFCSKDDPNFLAKTSSLGGHALNYAERAKNEAIVGLAENDAKAVLIAAADPARAMARAKLHELANPFDREATVLAVINYCNSEGASLVRNELATHDRNHGAFLDRIKRARQ